MPPSLPPLNWFRAFEAAARHLSFTAAGEEIGMTQSAVSQQIKSLELRLGAPLFDRKPRGLALTDDGRRLLPQVDAALATLSAATGSFFSGKPESLLTVSASITVLQWVISPLLPIFRKAHPDIAIRFMSVIWPDELSRTVADVEIRFGSRQQAGPQAVLLGGNQLVALKAPSLAGSIETLPLIETVGISDGWTAWSEAAGVFGLAPSLFVDTYGAALDLTVQGNGVCLVNEFLSQQPLREGLVEVLRPERMAGNEAYYLSVRRETEDARSFAKWIADAAME